MPTFIIDLPLEVEQELRQEAARQGMDFDRFLQAALTRAQDMMALQRVIDYLQSEEFHQATQGGRHAQAMQTLSALLRQVPGAPRLVVGPGERLVTEAAPASGARQIEEERARRAAQTERNQGAIALLDRWLAESARREPTGEELTIAPLSLREVQLD